MGRTSDARARLLEATIDLVWLHSYGSVSVDDICERAGVKKGSFYHFFVSKDDLVVAALHEHWAQRQQVLEEIFSSDAPPLDRLRVLFQNVYERQKEHKSRTGRVLGCLHASIGTECIEQCPKIGRVVQGILRQYVGYFEAALREAHTDGTVRLRDPEETARHLFAYMEGALGQARIANDPEILRGLASAGLALVGPQTPAEGERARRPRSGAVASSRIVPTRPAPRGVKKSPHGPVPSRRG